MIYDSYPKPFRDIVAEFEAEHRAAYRDKLEIFPLFEPKELDSFLTNYKINRITDLQHKTHSVQDRILIHGVCTEILQLRLTALRAREEHFAKQKSNSVKSTLTNIAALTTMVVAVGGFIVTHLGEASGKK